MLAPDYAVLIIVLVATATGLLTAAWFASRIALISIEEDSSSANARLINNEHKAADDNTTMSVPEIARAIADGANAFLYAEYQYAHTRHTQQACRAVVSRQAACKEEAVTVMRYAQRRCLTCTFVLACC